MNKKTLLLVAILTATIAKTFALDITDKKNLFGFNGGFGITTMGIEKENDDAKNRVKIGGTAGFSFEHRFPKVVAFEIGANYTNKGGQQKIENSGLNRSFYRLNFHSVEMPVIVKFYIGRKKIFNLNVGGYASYAFNVQSRLKVDYKDNSFFKDIDERKNNLLKNDNNPKDADGQRAFRPYDAGVNVGFEFVSRKGLGAGARIQQGLVDYTNPKFVLDDNKKVYHTSILFYALWKF